MPIKMKITTTAIVVLVICFLAFAYWAWVIMVEMSNPTDILMKFSMTISNSDPDIKWFKRFFSGRIKRNLNDSDFELLHNNFSNPEAWQEFFNKIPEEKFRWLPRKETNEFSLEGVMVNLWLAPGLTGLKIDGLQSVVAN